MTDSTQPEQEIERLNRALRDRASVGQWRDFALLMRQRDRLLESLPAEAQRSAVEATLEANAAILAHARADRESMRERLDGVRQKSAVSSYYRNHSGATPD